MKPVLALLLAALPCITLAQQVYRCTEGGKTSYSQVPCHTGQNNVVNTRPNSIDTSMDHERVLQYIDRQGAENKAFENAPRQVYRGPGSQTYGAAPTRELTNGSPGRYRPGSADDPHASYNPRQGRRGAAEGGEEAQSSSMARMKGCVAGKCRDTDGNSYIELNGGKMRRSDGASCRTNPSGRVDCF